MLTVGNQVQITKQTQWVLMTFIHQFANAINWWYISNLQLVFHNWSKSGVFVCFFLCITVFNLTVWLAYLLGRGTVPRHPCSLVYLLLPPLVHIGGYSLSYNSCWGHLCISQGVFSRKSHIPSILDEDQDNCLYILPYIWILSVCLSLCLSVALSLVLRIFPALEDDALVLSLFPSVWTID